MHQALSRFTVLQKCKRREVGRGPGNEARCAQFYSHGSCDWIVSQRNAKKLCHFFVIVWRWGTSLAYEQRLLPRYITQQVYTTAWQEIVKPKALELRVLRVIVRTITSYCIGTERSDRAQFMRRTCFSPFKPYLQLRETLLNSIYAVEM